MTVTAEKIVGRVGPGWWTQVHDFERENERLVAAVSFKEGLEEGREGLSRLHELYFGGEPGKITDRLKRAIEEMTNEFRGMEVAAVVVEKMAVYLGVTGGAGIWVRVGEKEGWAVDPNSKTVVLSGWGKEGEVIVLGNSRFWANVTVGAVRANLNEAGGTETLAAMIHGNEEAVGAVGAIVTFGRDKPPDFAPSTSLRASPGKQISWMPKRGTVYINYGDAQKNKKRMVYLGVGFLALLAVMTGGWQVKQRNDSAKRSELNQKIEAVKYKYEEAKALVQLNPVRSRQLLAEVDEEIKGINDERLKEMKTNLREVLEAASGIKKTDVQVVLDLGLVREGMRGAGMQYLDGKLWILDVENGRLVRVDPVKKSGEVMAGKEALGGAKLEAVYPGKVTILSDKGIVECLVLGAQCSVKIEPDQAWAGAVDMGMFAGNIYLLRDGGIWRYQTTESGYGNRQEWLATPGIGEVANMAIDGFVWVMKKDGSIIKYARGAGENFTILGLDKGLMTGGTIYTDEDSEKLYLLDTGNSRLVVVSKTGEYESQYVNDKIKEASRVVVDEKGGQIYLLAGNMIYSIKL